MKAVTRARGIDQKNNVTQSSDEPHKPAHAATLTQTKIEYRPLDQRKLPQRSRGMFASQKVFRGKMSTDMLEKHVHLLLKEIKLARQQKR